MKEFISKGVKGFQKGHPVPEHIRMIISKKMKGGNSGSFRKGHVGYWIDKISPCAGWNRGKTYDELYGDKAGEVKNKIREGNTGKHSKEKNPWWRGGISSLRKKIYVSSEFKIWRKAVFERDNYTCQECGKRGCELHAHHIKPFSLYPELRFVVSNGKTLCLNCHKKTLTYGNFLFTNRSYGESLA